MKCPNCGTELEGDRCPKCDYKYDKEYDKAIDVLMKLPHIGEKRAKALYQHGFADMDSIKKGSIDRLAKIDGLSEGLAEKIKESVSKDKLQTTEKGLFVCSECGALISEDSTNCPICGVPLIEEVEMDEIEDVKTLAKDKLQTTDKGLFVCSECGSLISEDSANCPKCGVPLIDDDEIETETEEIKSEDKLESEKVVFVCSECGSLISEDSENCPKCGVPLIVDIEIVKETVESEEIKAENKLQSDKGLFVCSECGSLISEDSANCPKCGVPLIEEVEMDEEVVEEEEIDITENIIGKIIDKQEALESPIMDELDKLESVTKEKAPIEVVGMIFDDKIKICGECGAFIKQDQDICEICGAKIAESGTYIETQKDSTDVLKQMFKIDEISIISEKEEDKKIKMCSVCGAVAVDIDICPVCGSETLEVPTTEEMDIEVSLVEDFAICPVCGALVDKNSKSCSICNSELPEVIKIPETIEKEKDETIEATKTLEIVTGKSLLEASPVFDVEDKDIQICPVCGGFVKEKFTRCPKCDAILKPEVVEKESVEPILPERKVKKVKQKVKAKEIVIPEKATPKITAERIKTKPIKAIPEKHKIPIKTEEKKIDVYITSEKKFTFREFLRDFGSSSDIISFSQLFISLVTLILLLFFRVTWTSLITIFEFLFIFICILTAVEMEVSHKFTTKKGIKRGVGTAAVLSISFVSIMFTNVLFFSLTLMFPVAFTLLLSYKFRKEIFYWPQHIVTGILFIGFIYLNSEFIYSYHYYLLFLVSLNNFLIHMYVQYNTMKKSHLEEFEKADLLREETAKEMERTLKKPELWHTKSSDFIKQGRYADAVKLLEKSLKLNDSNEVAWNNLGIVYARTHKFENAIKCLKKSLRLNPKYKYSWNNLGNVYARLGQYEHAMKYYDKAIEIDASYKDAWINKGYVLIKLGKYNDAINCANEIESIANA